MSRARSSIAAQSARWLEICFPVVNALRSAGRDGAALFNTVVMFQRVLSGPLLHEFSLATSQPDATMESTAVALADLLESARQAWKPRCPRGSVSRLQSPYTHIFYKSHFFPFS